MVSRWYHGCMAMTLRLTEEQDRKLQELADIRRTSKQEAAVWAIEETARRSAQLRDEVLRRIVTEDAELLRLLSK